MSLAILLGSNTKYTKAKRKNLRKMIRFSGLGMSVLGLLMGLYFFFPLFSYEFYLKPVFADQAYASPIPKSTIITKDYIESLWKNTTRSFQVLDFNNAQNWVPATYKETQVTTSLSSYNISIPKLSINNASVTTIDTDLGEHLVNFPGTAVPPNIGTAVIFGHSTLPQLFNPSDYHTIFANAHTLEVGDLINVSVNNTLYTYKIFDIAIVDPEDTSYLTQQYDDSYLTIVTCTPPGTTWKRLIIHARLEKL